jgi:S-adenosylmethionine:tRNA ribosyltransferase-isomerase
MHGEVFSISLNTLMHLITDHSSGRTVAVGTTSMRALESLYWLGIKIARQEISSEVMPALGQWECYELEPTLSLQESLQQIIKFCMEHDLSEFTASTSIIIAPSFQFRICDGIVTNFHMPQSTLLVLVSAFIGERWKWVYEHAMQNNYRFLSYGDSSLLWK